MKTKIKVNNLTFSYPTKTDNFKALENVSFNVDDGEFVCIIGPSGCGKTTLLNCLAGLLKPTQGNIIIDGQSAVVFQDPLLLPWRNVLKNIIYGLEIQKTNAEEIKKRAKKILATLKLTNFPHFYPHQLSGGMKQRVNLGRALICNPDILFLDEPLSHLDPQTREQLQLEILKIFKKEKKTFIFVTHLIEEAIFLADKLIIMEKVPGKVKKIIKISFTKPRSLEIKQTRKFLEYKNTVNNILSLTNPKKLIEYEEII